jgi:hypothetical protein
MTKTCVVLASLASLLFAGCSKKSSGSADCASAVDKGVQAMMAGGLEHAPEDQKAAMQAQMKEVGDKLKDILTRHCVEDKWPAEVVDCYNKAASQPEIRACRSKLPPDQAEKVGADVRQVMMASGMRGMHGGMRGGPGAPGAPDSSGAMGGGAMGSASPGGGAMGSAPANGSGSAVGAPAGSASGAPAGSAASVAAPGAQPSK